jgi:hypothetical protein
LRGVHRLGDVARDQCRCHRRDAFFTVDDATRARHRLEPGAASRDCGLSGHRVPQQDHAVALERQPRVAARFQRRSSVPINGAVAYLADGVAQKLPSRFVPNPRAVVSRSAHQGRCLMMSKRTCIIDCC